MDDDQPMVEPESSTGSRSLADKHNQASLTIKHNCKNKKIRRGGKKHSRKQIINFSLLGNNAAGIKAKKESLEVIINVFNKPSCITIQETKLAKSAIFQIENYQVFQKNRNGENVKIFTNF